MSGYVTLAFRRVSEELSTGNIFLTEGETTRALHFFQKVSYKETLRLLAEYLVKYPTARAAMLRLERDNVPPYIFSAEETELFRTDPVEIIRRCTFPHQTIVVGPPPEKPVVRPQEVNVMPSLPAGPEVRVQCFGETVYLRALDGRVECATCGAWCAAGWGVETTAESTSPKTYVCMRCHNFVRIVEEFDGWCGVLVEELLKLNAPRYFLPRPWHSNGNWISLSQLQNKYDEYVREKEASCPTVIP